MSALEPGADIACYDGKCAERILGTVSTWSIDQNGMNLSDIVCGGSETLYFLYCSAPIWK